MLYSKHHDPLTSPKLEAASPCVVCGSLLPPSEEEGRLCLQWSCKQELEKRKRAHPLRSKCRYCFMLLPYHRMHLGSCEAAPCQAAYGRQRQRQISLQNARAMRVRIASLRASFGLAEEEAVRVVPIPGNSRPMVPLRADDQRVRSLYEHLLSLFAQIEQEEIDDTGQDDAFDRDAEVLEADDRAGVPSFLVEGACRTCKGRCCLHGGEQAYLDVDTIRRIQRQEPQLSKEAIIEGLMDALHEEVYKGSCIYHGATGCGLPTSWRSDTCNQYYCGPLHTLLRRPAEEVVVVSIEQNELIRAARCTEDAYESLSLPTEGKS